MHPHLATALIAAIVALGTSAAFQKYGPAPKPQLVTVQQSGGELGQTTLARLSRDVWPEIAQSEVDRLSNLLDQVPKGARRAVTIFCQDDAKCGDLALNLENAFETARWTVERKTVPLPDGASGVGVNDGAMAGTIGTATSLKPEKVDADLAGGIAIVIGAKPR